MGTWSVRSANGKSIYAFIKSSSGKNHEVNKINPDGSLAWKEGQKLKGIVSSIPNENILIKPKKII